MSTPEPLATPPLSTPWVPLWPLSPPPPVPLVTALPGSPTDGQEVVLVDSLTNPLYQWRLRYNAGSVSNYKWECVGGIPWRGGPSGSRTLGTAANDWGGLTGGPSLVIPREGAYVIDFGVFAQVSVYASDFNTAMASFASGASGRGAVFQALVMTDQSLGGRQIGSERRTLIAGETLSIQVFVAAAQTTNFSDGVLSVLPARVI